MLRERLTNAYLALIPLITINFLWFFACLPIVTAIPATGALFYSTNKLVHGNGADWRTFVEGFRACFRFSWGWGLLNVIVVVLLVSNYLFYAQMQRGAGTLPWLPALVIVITFLWLMLQVYIFPLMLQQEKPSLRNALRNALIILIRRPFYTVAVTLVIVLIVVVSTLLLVPAWVFITASLCAYIANASTLSAIEKITGKQRLSSEIDA
jgi:uncharacterized membrane protein YesL